MSHTVHPASTLAESFLQLVSDPKFPKLTILLGGGSIIDALTPAFQQMAEMNRTWENISLSLIDERYFADLANPEINFNKLKAIPSMFQLESQGLEALPVLVRDASLIQTGVHFDDFLELKLADSETKLIGIVGIGSDYHVAGIVPHKPEHDYIFHENLGIGYAVDDVSSSDNPYRERVTITFTGLSKLAECWVYASHKSKQPVLKIITGDKQPVPVYHERPAAYLWELKNLQVFADIA